MTTSSARLRHLLVLLILVGTVISGKNIEGIALYTPLQFAKMLEKPAGASRISIDASSPSYEVPASSEVAPGSWYRYSLRYTFPARKVATAAGIRLEKPQQDIIRIERIAAAGTHQELLRKVIKVSDTSDSLYVVYKQEELGDRIVVTREDVNAGPLYLDKSSLIQLAVTSQAEADALAAPIAVTTGLQVITEETWQEKPTREVAFRKDGQVVSSVITATKDTISVVELPIHVIGTGGNGRYRLQVREVGGPILAANDFVIDDRRYLEDAEDASSPRRTLHIPLAIATTVGKDYEISVTNAGVAINWFNTLALYVNNEGELIHRTSASTLVSKSLPVGPAGVALDQIDAQRWRFGYKSSGDFTDIDALDKDAILRQRTNGGGVFFDTVRSGVVATTTPDMYLQYHFEAPFSFETARLNVSQILDDFHDIYVSYSLDGVIWKSLQQEVRYRPDQNHPSPIISGVLNVAGTKDIYIRIGYLTGSAAKAPAFGITGISLDAILRQP